MKAGESMRRNFAQILKDAKIDIKVEYQKLYGMLYDRSIQVSNTNRISVYDELSTFFIAFHFRGTCLSLDEFNVLYEKAKERNKNDFDKLAQLEVISKAVKLRDNLHVKINVFDLLRDELKELDSLVLKSTTKASPTEHREVHIKAKGCLLYTSPSPRD